MILEGTVQAFRLLFGLSPEVWGPVWVSLSVSITSTFLSTILALPAGLALGLGRFRGRRLSLGLFNTLMSLPTVLVGLIVYALLTRRGPLGDLELLYTKTAMVIGQVILAFPIMTGLVAASADKADPRILEAVLGLGGGHMRAVLVVASEMRTALVAAVAAGFGRVFSEVGISMMVGGNIRGVTRNITTGIAFETGKGEFAKGVALGIVLLVVALAVNLVASALNRGRRT
ncbi:MAG: ABC transporter permease subunit [Deltaproteobacteria bacterium]|nr:MAG: ABC transporter permease subunit [Deltaproteobacteria bacterium]